MRRSAASSISSADRCAASATTTKEGTTGKCYPSPEYKLLPITWTVQLKWLTIQRGNVCLAPKTSDRRGAELLRALERESVDLPSAIPSSPTGFRRVAEVSQLPVAQLRSSSFQELPAAPYS